MICKNCGQARGLHAGESNACIGKASTFQLKINNMSATFLYNNERGVAESRDCTLYFRGRPLAKLDNILHQLLTDGNTDISINVTLED